MEVSGQLHASTAVLPGKETPVPIEYEAVAVGEQSQSGYFRDVPPGL